MFSPAQERQRARMSRLMDRELPPRYRCSKPAVSFTICSQRAETTVARFLALPVCGAALNARVRPRQPTSARSRARRTRTARTARTRPRGGPGPNGTNTRREGRRRPRTRGPRSRQIRVRLRYGYPRDILGVSWLLCSRVTGTSWSATRSRPAASSPSWPTTARSASRTARGPSAGKPASGRVSAAEVS